MRLKRRPDDGFNMSFLDVMACGLGAIILIFILVDFHAYQPEPTDETNKLQQELNAAARQREQLQKSIDELNEKIAMESSTQQDSRSSQADTRSTQSKLLQQISTELAVVADLEKQLAAIARLPVPDANVQLSGSGQQNYITGLKVEGQEIGILLDKSASMMGDNLLEILRFMALPDNQKIIKIRFDRDITSPTGFVTSTPARIALDFANTNIQPGDQILVLPKVDEKKRQFWKDMTQILYQIAVSAKVVFGSW